MSLNDGRDLITVKLLYVTVNKYELKFVNLFCMHVPFQFCKYLIIFLNVHIPVNPDCRNSEIISLKIFNNDYYKLKGLLFFYFYYKPVKVYYCFFIPIKLLCNINKVK